MSNYFRAMNEDFGNNTENKERKIMSNKRSFLDISSDIAETKADFWLSEKEIDEKLSVLYDELANKENGVY